MPFALSYEAFETTSRITWIFFDCIGDTIRLVNGYSNNSGRVEVRVGTSWRTVCDDQWYLSDATVTCRQLGFKDAVLNYRNSFFGKGSGPIGMEQVRCSGEESSVSSCSEDVSYITSCTTNCWDCQTAKCFHELECHLNLMFGRKRRSSLRSCERERISVCGHNEEVGVLCGSKER
ncbi:Galectin-3-binding protein [Holothuria leucospilota]|uniref:Galectin-3-binding protein n=1 Tax=Holothuria leucospilota TaxID=206669 RepID=A0A9Q1H463_HOLLE|nr:Galectin-3-binding protein [Holothuria leucospilota]